MPRTSRGSTCRHWTRCLSGPGSRYSAGGHLAGPVWCRARADAGSPGDPRNTKGDVLPQPHEESSPQQRAPPDPQNVPEPQPAGRRECGLRGCRSALTSSSSLVPGPAQTVTPWAVPSVETRLLVRGVGRCRPASASASSSVRGAASAQGRQRGAQSRDGYWRARVHTGGPGFHPAARSAVTTRALQSGQGPTAAPASGPDAPLGGSDPSEWELAFAFCLDNESSRPASTAARRL